MQKIVTIFILFVFAFSVNPQNREDSYKINCPSYIPVNSSFDISLVTTNRFPKADTLELYILPGPEVSLNSIRLNTLLWKSNLEYKSYAEDGFSGPAYKCIIDLSDSAFTSGSFFQFIISFKNENSLRSSLKLFGVFKKNDEILGFINSRIKSKKIKESEYITVPIKFYNVQRVAGKSLLFSNNAYLDFSLKGAKTDNLLTEFWLKLNNSEEQIIKITNKIVPGFQYSIATNKFQILAVDSKSGSQLFSNPCFVSLKNWYHIAVLFSVKDNIASFYCNSSLVAKYKLNSFIETKDLIFEFYNFEDKESFQIDLLRIVDLNNSINFSFNNKNFQSFAADSSSVFAQLKINNLEDLLSFQNILEINYSGLQLVKSDAPIFAKAPELNIKMLTNSYELEWTGGDYKQAEKYILEKSLKNSEFVPVYTTDADNLNEKNYSYLDQKENSSDVVYFRIKQVDKDGSIVYSSQVKVGQGLFEPFLVEQNFPNPFNPRTSIIVELLQDADVKVVIYNLEGKEIVKLQDGFLEKGVHKFKFDATELPSGVYLYKVETPEFSQTRKMVLTK